MKTKYPSAIDAWLIAVLVGVPLLVIGLGIFTLTKSVPAGIVQIAVGIAIGAAILAFAFPCYYVVDSRFLKIKCGILEEEVALDRIRGIETSNSLLSAPALSLRRVKLSLDDGFRLVSPKERAEFIQSIEQYIKKK